MDCLICIQIYWIVHLELSYPFNSTEHFHTLKCGLFHGWACIYRHMGSCSTMDSNHCLAGLRWFRSDALPFTLCRLTLNLYYSYLNIHFVLLDFEKWGQTDVGCENNGHDLVGRVDQKEGSINFPAISNIVFFHAACSISGFSLNIFTGDCGSPIESLKTNFA